MSRNMRFTKFFTIANPPAGVGAQITVGQGENWLVRALKFNLVTNATVGNRQPYITFTKDGSAIYIAGSNINVPANTTQIFSAAPGVPTYQSVYTILDHIALPQVWLPQGTLIQIFVNGMSAGDQLSAVTLGVERG